VPSPSLLPATAFPPHGPVSFGRRREKREERLTKKKENKNRGRLRPASPNLLFFFLSFSALPLRSRRRRAKRLQPRFSWIVHCVGISIQNPAPPPLSLILVGFFPSFFLKRLSSLEEFFRCISTASHLHVKVSLFFGQYMYLRCSKKIALSVSIFLPDFFSSSCVGAFLVGFDFEHVNRLHQVFDHFPLVMMLPRLFLDLSGFEAFPGYFLTCQDSRPSPTSKNSSTRQLLVQGNAPPSLHASSLNHQPCIVPNLPNTERRSSIVLIYWHVCRFLSYEAEMGIFVCLFEITGKFHVCSRKLLVFVCCYMGTAILITSP
jgi:hypothetical protein